MATEIGFNEKSRNDYNRKLELKRIAEEMEAKRLEEERHKQIQEIEKKKKTFHKAECRYCGSIFTYNENEEKYGNWRQCTFDGGEECEVYVDCPHCGKEVIVRHEDRYC